MVKVVWGRNENEFRVTSIIIIRWLRQVLERSIFKGLVGVASFSLVYLEVFSSPVLKEGRKGVRRKGSFLVF